MNLLSPSHSPTPFMQSRGGVRPAPVRAATRFKSLNSMLPALFVTGVITLITTGIMRLAEHGLQAGLLANWLESWLIAWAIAFPVAYLIGPALLKTAARLSGVERPLPAAAMPGLGWGDIAGAAADATASNGLRVRRNRHPYFGHR